MYYISWFWNTGYWINKLSMYTPYQIHQRPEGQEWKTFCSVVHEVDAVKRNHSQEHRAWSHCLQGIVHIVISLWCTVLGNIRSFFTSSMSQLAALMSCLLSFSPWQIDNKKWSEGDFSYLNLLWKREPGNEIVKSWNSGLSPSTKDSFTISTIFCSTKLTQNGIQMREREGKRKNIWICMFIDLSYLLFASPYLICFLFSYDRGVTTSAGTGLEWVLLGGWGWWSRGVLARSEESPGRRTDGVPPRHPRCSPRDYDEQLGERRLGQQDFWGSGE